MHARTRVCVWFLGGLSAWGPAGRAPRTRNFHQHGTEVAKSCDVRTQTAGGLQDTRRESVTDVSSRSSSLDMDAGAYKQQQEAAPSLLTPEQQVRSMSRALRRLRTRLVFYQQEATPLLLTPEQQVRSMGCAL